MEAAPGECDSDSDDEREGHGSTAVAPAGPDGALHGLPRWRRTLHGSSPPADANWGSRAHPERSHGRLRAREFEKPRYDIESRVSRTGKRRFIEVKGRVAAADFLTATKNEILYSLNTPESFILAIVECLSDGARFTPFDDRSRADV